MGLDNLIQKKRREETMRPCVEDAYSWSLKVRDDNSLTRMEIISK